MRWHLKWFLQLRSVRCAEEQFTIAFAIRPCNFVRVFFLRALLVSTTLVLRLCSVYPWSSLGLLHPPVAAISIVFVFSALSVYVDVFGARRQRLRIVRTGYKL